MLNEKIISIDSGRDSGKHFLVKEMPVSKLEKWSAKVLCALFSGNIPDDIAQSAKTSNAVAVGSAIMKGLSGVDWEKVEPLYDELLDQIYRIPQIDKPKHIVELNKSNLDAHIEDASTIFKLRIEAVAISLNFLLNGKVLNFQFADNPDQ